MSLRRLPRTNKSTKPKTLEVRHHKRPTPIASMVGRERLGRAPKQSLRRRCPAPISGRRSLPCSGSA